MPNRVIRESMLDSDRYSSLPTDSERLLFIELLLLADDFGLVPLNYAFLRRRVSPCVGKTEKQALVMLEHLIECDLIRTYHSESGSLFGYIPRFGNVPRAKKPKWPLPPDIPSFNEINKLARFCCAPTCKSTSSAGRALANAPETETETETEKKYTPAEAGGAGGRASVGPAQVAPVVAPPGVSAGDSSEQAPRVKAKKPPKRAGDSLDAETLAKSIGVARPIVEAWLTIRIQKKVGPVTAGAFEMLRAEAGKAGIPVSEAVSECVSRGWAGFKASWLANEVRGGSVVQAQPVNKFAGVL